MLGMCLVWSLSPRRLTARGLRVIWISGIFQYFSSDGHESDFCQCCHLQPRSEQLGCFSSDEHAGNVPICYSFPSSCFGLECEQCAGHDQHVLGCSARFDHSLYEWQDLLNSETQVTGMLDGSACLDGVPDSVSRVDKQCLRKSHCCEHLLVTNLLPLIMHSCKALMLKPKERKTQTGKRTCIQHSKSRWW